MVAIAAVAAESTACSVVVVIAALVGFVGQRLMEVIYVDDAQGPALRLVFQFGQAIRIPIKSEFSRVNNAGLIEASPSVSASTR